LLLTGSRLGVEGPMVFLKQPEEKGTDSNSKWPGTKEGERVGGKRIFSNVPIAGDWWLAKSRDRTEALHLERRLQMWEIGRRHSGENEMEGGSEGGGVANSWVDCPHTNPHPIPHSHFFSRRTPPKNHPLLPK